MPEKQTLRRARKAKREEGSLHASRGVRPGGDWARSPRQARRAFDKAGDCDWPIQGAARRGEAPAARQREDVGGDQEESRRGRQTRPKR